MENWINLDIYQSPQPRFSSCQGPKLAFRTSLLATSSLSTSQIVWPNDQAVPPLLPRARKEAEGEGKLVLEQCPRA